MRIAHIAHHLDDERHGLTVELARLTMPVRGYGHDMERKAAQARVRDQVRLAAVERREAPANTAE